MHSLIVRRLVRLRAGVIGAGVVACLLSGCAVHDATPPGVSGAPGNAPAVTTAPSHPTGVVSTAPSSHTSVTGRTSASGAGTSSTPASTATAHAAASSSALSPQSALLTAQDIGAHWGRVQYSSGPVSSSDQHQYCGAEFTSDGSLTTDAQATLARNTDGLRIEEEVARYAGNGAATAMSEYRAAYTQCRDYTTGSGADALTIHLDPVTAPKYGDDAVAVLMTLTKGSIVLYAHEVVTREGPLVMLASVVSDNQNTVATTQAWLVDLAARRAQMRGA